MAVRELAGPLAVEGETVYPRAALLPIPGTWSVWKPAASRPALSSADDLLAVVSVARALAYRRV